VFGKWSIVIGLAKLGLALNSDLVRAKDERDRAVAELEARDERLDRLPGALQSALFERDAFRQQRDQAYGEIDDLCRERNELKGQLERLRKASGG
jgi:uncharacterized coiled-coil DUF342 family protein